VMVEVYDARKLPRGFYVGSLCMTGEQRASLAGELAGAAAVRALHRPCHEEGDPPRLCGYPHVNDKPSCRECFKPHPCPTVEVLPS
jgi:hypothetical protein